MPCLFLLLTVFFPRLALVLLFFFSWYLDAAYHSHFLALILGFIFLPLTTLAYAWMVNSHLAAAGANLLVLFVAVLLDLGLVGGGYRSHRARN